MVESDKPLRARTTGAGGFELRCASLQGVPCLEFKGTGDCEHTRAVLVRETGGLVAVLDLLREELREAQVEIAALRPLADITSVRLAVPGEQLAASFGHFEEPITLEGDRAMSSGVQLSRLFDKDDGESP